MPTSLEHDPKYRYRKVNRGRYALKMRTNGIRYDVPNTTHLREKMMRKERVLKSTKPKGKAKLLKLPNIVTWLIYTCSHPCLFCLRLRDHALTPCTLALCVYMQRKE